jgi:uncharacterized protein (TIGR03083 family)
VVSTQRTDAENILPLVHEARAKLGIVLESLADTDWARPTLCAGWSVRDVVAHCTQSHAATPLNLVREMLVAGFSLDRRNAKWVAQRRSKSNADLLAEYRETAAQTAFPAAEAPYALLEAVIHGLDIAYPIGRELDLAPGTLIATADIGLRTGPIFHSKQRGARLCFHASNVEWTAGDGPDIAGPIESIILAINGRAAALNDLSGPGLATLAARI